MNRDVELLKDIRDEAVVTIAAAEGWAPIYKRDKRALRELAIADDQLLHVLRDYFKGLADRAMGFVNWSEYRMQAIKAYDVVLEQDQSQWDAEQQIMLQVFYPELQKLVTIGLESGVRTYHYEMEADRIALVASQQAMKHAGELIKGLLQTTRDQVKQSIETSLKLGEDNYAAAARLNEFIDNEKRALMIARTETVTSYNIGMREFAKANGALAKEWQTGSNPCPICESNALDGTIGEGLMFSSGDLDAPAHPNCMCGVVYYWTDPLGRALPDSSNID